MKRAPKSAAKVVVLDNGDPISTETEAIQRRIRQRAFELSQTRPEHARELYDWIVAQSEIMSVPPVKLMEKNGKFEAKFAIPGLDPKDVSVMVSSDQILVKGESNDETESEEGVLHFSDFRSATVFRSVSLPAPIDTKSVKVDFEDGVLRVSAMKEGAVPTELAGAKRATPTRKAPARKKSRE